MIKIYNKIVESIKAPENKNDIWLNKGVFHIYKQGEWKPFTVDLATANKLKEMAEKDVLLTPGEGIIIEDNEINLTLKTVNGKSIIGEGNIVIEGGTSNGVESEEVASTIPTPEFPYVTKSELTELSAEVSGLSERVDALGEGGAQEILKVEYGKTTFQEIKDAFVAGKYIVFEYANNVFHINRVTDTEIYFVSINCTLGYRVGLNNKNNWYQNVYQNEQSTNKVTSLSSSSTDTQYPSAKAVYDFVNNTLGTIINGDY